MYNMCASMRMCVLAGRVCVCVCVCVCVRARVCVYVYLQVYVIASDKCI